MDNNNNDELHKQVLAAIEYIKLMYRVVSGEQDPEKALKRVLRVFRQGNCGNFFSFLREEFGEEAKPYIVRMWYDDGAIRSHMIVKVGDRYYDIGGEFDEVEYTSSEHIEYYTIEPAEERDVSVFSDNNPAEERNVQEIFKAIQRKVIQQNAREPRIGR